MKKIQPTVQLSFPAYSLQHCSRGEASNMWGLLFKVGPFSKRSVYSLLSDYAKLHINGPI